MCENASKCYVTVSQSWLCPPVELRDLTPLQWRFSIVSSYAVIFLILALVLIIGADVKLVIAWCDAMLSQACNAACLLHQTFLKGAFTVSTLDAFASPLPLQEFSDPSTHSWQFANSLCDPRHAIDPLKNIRHDHMQKAEMLPTGQDRVFILVSFAQSPPAASLKDWHCDQHPSMNTWMKSISWH